MWVLTNDFFRFNFATEKFSIKRTNMKIRNVVFLFVTALLLSGIWPPDKPGPIGSPAPGQPPIIVVIPGGGK